MPASRRRSGAESDLAKGLEKERQEAATTLEGFKAQLTLAAEVRRQMAARKVDALVNVINVTHTLIGRVLALKEEGENRVSVSDGSAEFMSPRMKAFNEYGLAYRQAEAFADTRSNQAMFDFLRLLQEKVTASSVSDILAASPVLEAGRRELIAAIREDLQLS